jgi:hypothetical protein
MIQLTALNYFLFWLPPLAWNAVFTSRLSMPSFSGSVPRAYEVAEWVFRIGTMVYPLFLPIRPEAGGFTPGLIIYSGGLLLYFASWVPYMIGQHASVFDSPVFQFAPAYLPLVWMTGMAVMAESPILAGLSVIFMALHVGEYVMRYAK